MTAKAYDDRIVTSTLGCGRGYDESLLAAIARSGSGNHVFADDPDAAGAAIAGEVDGLLSKVVQAFERGEFETGQRLMGETKSRLTASLEVAPEALKPEIRAELDEVEQMDRMSFDMGAASAPMMSKMSRESFHRRQP